MVRFASIENKLNLDNNGEKFDNAERVDGLRNINHIDPLYWRQCVWDQRVVK